MTGNHGRNIAHKLRRSVTVHVNPGQTLRSGVCGVKLEETVRQMITDSSAEDRSEPSEEVGKSTWPCSRYLGIVQVRRELVDNSI